MHVTIADIALPLWLIISQWTLLFALGFLVIIMYRQVGFLQQLKDQGSEREGLPLGEKAPAFDYTPVKGSVNAAARFEPAGKWSLLVFADPACVTCQNTLLALERMSPKLARTMRVLVATTAEPAQIGAVDAFRTAPVEIGRVSSDVLSRLYHTGVTPFGHVIDPEGKVRARGIATDESSIRQMVRRMDRNTFDVEQTIP